ncbi:MAG: TrkA family potassium uptake protein [Jiangellales bacterium]
MNVVILGCGRVGSTLANALEDMGHQVSVIDQDPNSFRRLGPTFEGRTVTGVGFDPDVLRSAGIEQADAFAAVSSGDNSNIIATRVAREEFGVDNVAARIYDQGRAEVFERLGIPTVATVGWTADQLIRRLVPQGSATHWTDPSGEVRLAEIDLDPGWRGRTVRQLERASGGRMALLTRLGSGVVPMSETVVQDGDVVHMVLPVQTAADVVDTLGNPPED